MSEAQALHSKQAPASGALKSIEIRSLSKTYQTRKGLVEAVRDVTFSVTDGEFVSLVGPSGCGKSTILKIVAGLVSCEEGSVQVAGDQAKAGRRDVGIMLQAPVLLPWRSVLKNVLLPAEIFGLKKGEARKRAEELLELVGLQGFEDKNSWELSGGMQQRVSLARQLVFDPSILLMDEPFAALDEFTRERLNLELTTLHQRLHRSVLYVTHNILESVFLSDRVVVMKPRPGEIIEIVDIDLPRPRSLEMLNAERTQALVGEIRTMFTTHEGDENDG